MLATILTLSSIGQVSANDVVNSVEQNLQNILTSVNENFDDHIN